MHESSRRRLLAYALPGFTTSFAALPLALFVPAFYGRELGVPLAAVGGALAFSRLLDVATDPLIGALSDRGALPGGRRKPVMLLGLPIFLIGVWAVFAPPAGAGALYLFGWSTVLFLGLTLVEVPYKAWGAELERSYDERSRVTAWREALGTVGQVALLIGLVWWGWRGSPDTAAELRYIALATAVLAPPLLTVALASVPEGPSESVRATRLPLGEAAAFVVRNPAFLRMLGCVVLFVSGIVIQGTLHRIVLTDIVGAPDWFAPMLLLENAATLCAIPGWLALSRRTSKHRALAAAALWLAVWSLPLIAFAGGSAGPFVAVVALRGSSFGAILLLSNALAADVIDLDTLASGRQRSGLYFAVWGMVTKASVALGVALATGLLQLVGYDPGSLPPDSLVSRSVGWVYGGLPALLMASGAMFLWRFPMDRARHAEVRTEIEARLSRLSRSRHDPS